MNLRHRLARVEISTRANWCRKFMSRIFMSRIFSRPTTCALHAAAPIGINLPHGDDDDDDCETFRIPPSVSKRTICIRDDGGESGVGGAYVCGAAAGRLESVYY